MYIISFPEKFASTHMGSLPSSTTIWPNFKLDVSLYERKFRNNNCGSYYGEWRYIKQLKQYSCWQVVRHLAADVVITAFDGQYLLKHCPTQISSSAKMAFRSVSISGTVVWKSALFRKMHQNFRTDRNTLQQLTWVSGLNKKIYWHPRQPFLNSCDVLLF